MLAYKKTQLLNRLLYLKALKLLDLLLLSNDQIKVLDHLVDVL